MLCLRWTIARRLSRSIRTAASLRQHPQDDFLRSLKVERSSLGEKLRDKKFALSDLPEINKGFFKPQAEKSAEEVQRFRDENEISILKGQTLTPDPTMTFEETGFSEVVLKSLRQMGFESPMAIQAQGWPIALSSKDLVAIGQTGSGKTLGNNALKSRF